MGQLAIVGTSKLEKDFERKFAQGIIVNELFREPVMVIVTGDASGVDEIARTTKSPDSTLRVFKAQKKEWEPDEGHGFKDRNWAIANVCDELICITTRTKKTKCYHCNADHERTGGCWTMQRAKEMGKPTRLYVI